MKSSRRSRSVAIPVGLTWSHCGIPLRVTPWPEVRFERLYGDEWIPLDPDEDALASAVAALGEREWQPYLEFVPGEVREFLGRFSFARMTALLVMAKSPALLPVLVETPALAVFFAAHARLRGTLAPGWAELGAVFERSGVFGLMEWLGLPASRQTLAILRNLAAPDLPPRFLEPLRTLLWEPRAIFALQRITAITDRHLARFCHALAA